MSTSAPSLDSPRPRRSPWVTILGWLVIVVSALILPVSFFSLLMILTGSPGTSPVEPMGALIVLGGPLASLVAGIGLLCRKQWARWFLAAVLSAVLITNIYSMIRGPTPTYSYTSADGVLTTVTSTGATYSVPLVVLSSVVLLFLFSRRVREEFGGAPRASVPAGRGFFSRGPAADVRRGWRVGHRGRDAMYYEERHGGQWRRIEIDGEMLMGRAHHVIYFASPERWGSYPEWARDRRDEIIARIKSEFREPDYEYYGDGVAARAAVSGDAVARGADVIPQPSRLKGSPGVGRARPGGKGAQGVWALVLGIVLLLGIAGAMSWLVKDGVQKGSTYFPAKLPSQRRSVVRAEEPAMFWTCIGLYGAAGAGTAGLALWLIREGWKLHKTGVS